MSRRRCERAVHHIDIIRYVCAQQQPAAVFCFPGVVPHLGINVVRFGRMQAKAPPFQRKFKFENSLWENPQICWILNSYCSVFSKTKTTTAVVLYTSTDSKYIPPCTAVYFIFPEGRWCVCLSQDRDKEQISDEPKESIAISTAYRSS